MKRVSLDIETLSTRARAVVLSVGICIFDDEEMNSFDEIVDNGIEIFFDPEEQKEAGRIIDESTLKWWSEQGDEARRVLEATDTIGVRDFHTLFEQFCVERDLHQNWLHRYGTWVARGPHFDMAILEDMFADFNVSTPWKYYNVRDIRTWLECRGLPDNLKLVKPDNMIAHNALHDAAFDAWMMQQVAHRPLDELAVDDGSKKG